MQSSSIQKFFHNNILVAYLVAILFLCFSIFVGISIGTLSIPFSTILTIFGSEVLQLPIQTAVEPMLTNIVIDIRAPRVLLALFVGASLAVAGAAFQGFLKNPLADPYTLGVSSGAAVGAVFVFFLGISLPILGAFTLPVVSIVSGFVTLFLVIFFARLVQRSMSAETIILAGIIFSSFLGSLISLMVAMTGEELRQIISWLMGSVAMRGWNYVYLIIPFFLLGTLLLLANSRELNALAFGEETAKHLGVNVQVRKMMILLGASLLTGSAVAVSGTIGFVGLVIPHLTRLLWGSDHRHLLPLSMLVGGGFLILTDLAARTILSPTELPIGVITALIGGPVFAMILVRQRRK
ncbi:FecCD family ABC transporter permease [Desertibacillus haloalkaliphilus]|uniref:FecCD family ABC transporter permease n=1 Tax=Desertibacillus haloalkaliphilus TaxID=1328930 RepID=UPI001C25B2EE|nr:iron ABC transporter permease [Desertibacillus haloalkaliphilus]MBU8907181.1 iron ABC transporter permease [Desertibacillus haloalkaliphilus]